MRYFRDDREIDAFEFLSEIGKYVDQIVGPGADESVVHLALMRAQEQAQTKEGLRSSSGQLFMREDA